MFAGVFCTRPRAINRVLAILVSACVTLAVVLGVLRTAVAAPTLSTELSESLLRLINKERSAAGIPALTLRKDLSKIAEEHALDMIETGYFGHISPTKGTLATRLREADIRFSKAAENLAGCTSPELAHKLLMASASHRANVLSERFTHIGVAVVKGGPYGMMIVEVFLSEPGDVSTEHTVDDESGCFVNDSPGNPPS